MKNVEYMLYSMNKAVILKCSVDYDTNEWGFFRMLFCESWIKTDVLLEEN